MQILRQALEEVELIRALTTPYAGMPSQKTRGSSLSRRPAWHSFCRGVTVVVETMIPMYSLLEVQWWELCQHAPMDIRNNGKASGAIAVSHG